MHTDADRAAPGLPLVVLAAASAAYLAALVWLAWWLVLALLVPGWTPVVITGDSMRPTIATGDLVVTTGVVPDALGSGDVVVFPDGGGGLVTHRIVGRRDDGLLRTRGDANAVADTRPVDPDTVLGRGKLLVPAVGRPLVWAQHGRWGHLVVWLVATGAAAGCVRRWHHAALAGADQAGLAEPEPGPPALGRGSFTARRIDAVARVGAGT